MWDERIGFIQELASPGVSVRLTVIPLEEPQSDAYGSRHSFRALARSPERSGAGWFGVQASAYIRDIPKIIPGSPVDCRAVLQVPSPAMNPGGFDYREYLLGERVLALAGIQGVLGPAPRTACLSFRTLAIKVLAAVKTYMARALDSTFPREDAAVLKAVFLGDRGELPPEDSRDFRRSGFYRFVGICGFHVDLLFVLTEGSLRRLTRRPSFSRLAAILFAFSYGCLSGWPAGVLRAFVSGLLRSLAPALRRRYHSLVGLGASALVVTWAIPFPLRNTGFLLSFAGAAGAWLGRVYAEAAGRGMRSAGLAASSGNDLPIPGKHLPPVDYFTIGSCGQWTVRAHAKMGRLAVMLLRPVTMCLVLLPVMASCFTEVSLVSFVLSGVWGSLAALMVPVAAVTSFVPPLGALFGWLPHILLRGVRAVSKVVAGAPLASVTIPAPGILEIGAYWALLAVPLASGGILGAVRGDEDALEFFRRRRLMSAIRRIALLCSVGFLFLSAVLRVYALVPEVTFLYVGQGDCAVVRKGSGVMIVDTGTTSAFESHVLPYLKAKGITRIDLCVISHLHADHAGGLPALCAEMDVGLVAVTPGFRDKARTLIDGGGVLPENRIPPIIEFTPGLRHQWNGAVLDVFLPDPGSYGLSEPTNESSAGFCLDLGNLEVEFWGDLPADLIEAAMETYRPFLAPVPGTSRVVKVPHHGSVDAYVPELYERASGGVRLSRQSAASPGPEAQDEQVVETIFVVSVGANSYGHPSNVVEEAARRGGRLFRTDEAGAVTVKSAFGMVNVRTFLPVPGRRTNAPGRNSLKNHLETPSGGPE
ncbi:MAG: ComEC/Rec2 family competence protein [Bacillota bacterium]|jgi:competence protein ComEC